MTIEHAIHRLTGEIGEWFQIDAGVLKQGSRADVVIIDPNELTEQLEAYEEAGINGFGDFKRLVRRNPKAVPHVIVNGKVASRDGEIEKGVGKTGIRSGMRCTT